VCENLESNCIAFTEHITDVPSVKFISHHTYETETKQRAR